MYKLLSARHSRFSFATQTIACGLLLSFFPAAELAAAKPAPDANNFDLPTCPSSFATNYLNSLFANYQNTSLTLATNTAEKHLDQFDVLVLPSRGEHNFL